MVLAFGVLWGFTETCLANPSGAGVSCSPSFTGDFQLDQLIIWGIIGVGIVVSAGSSVGYLVARRRTQGRLSAVNQGVET